MVNENKEKYQARQSEDKLTIEYELDDFKRNLPHLYAELTSKNYGENVRYPIGGVVHDDDIDSYEMEQEDYTEHRHVSTASEGEKLVDVEVRPKELYDPDVRDFIRRATTHEEAIEIIEYCLSRGEIDDDEAQSLKEQLDKFGLESFGPRKTWGYFERKYLRTTDFNLIEKSNKKKDSDQTPDSDSDDMEYFDDFEEE